ncbi:TIGR02391 family protein [Streptomyces sp. BBFR2]|uniref:TIGR02391 family protein n=1 Tax=Streptomyces sp. BBFR2 TaxID=3372854 RepID=UPI0037D9C6E2
MHLTFAGVANCPNSKGILNIFFDLVRFAARKEKEESRWTSQRVTVNLSISDFEHHAPEKLHFHRPIEFITLIAEDEPWCVRSSIGSGWEGIQIPASVVVDSRIRLFSEVHTLDEYLPARAELLSGPQSAYRRMALDGLHPDVISASGPLWIDGHYTQAVLSIFRHIESRVQELFGDHTESGQPLMAKAFSIQSDSLDVRRSFGMSGESEQIGFKFLFMGAMAGLRNPRAHGIPPADSEAEAYEALAFGSLLLRRLDIARERK